jgi:hypothetical protein
LQRFAAGLRITRVLPKDSNVSIANFLLKLIDFSRLYHFPDYATIMLVRLKIMPL